MNDKTNQQQQSDDFSLEEWVNTPFEQYDNQAAYLAEVQPMLDQLEEKCKAIGLPFLMMIASRQQGDKSSFHMQGSLQGIGKAPGLLMAARFAGNSDIVTANHVMLALRDRRRNFAPKPEGVTAH